MNAVLSNSGRTGTILVSADREWEAYDALPTSTRRLLSESNAKFPSTQVLNVVTTLSDQGFRLPDIEKVLIKHLDEVAHQAHLKDGSLAPKARGPLIARHRRR